MPIDFTIDFGAVKTVCGLGIRNRDGAYCDRLKAGYFEISKDGDNWARVAEFGFVKGQVDPNLDYKYWFEPAEARYMLHDHHRVQRDKRGVPSGVAG